MAAKYVLKKGTTGKFRFSLHASNGQIVATSEAYETKRAALAAIESVRKNAGAPLEDLTSGDGTAPARKAAAKKAPAKKAAARKTAAKKAPAKRAAARKS